MKDTLECKSDLPFIGFKKEVPSPKRDEDNDKNNNLWEKYKLLASSF